MLGLVTAAAASGRIAAPKPTLAQSAYGKVKITNYSPLANYTISVSAGSYTRSGDEITLSATNAICTVSASSPKGGASNDATFERRAYTYYYGSSQSCGDNCGSAYDCAGQGNPPGCRACWGFSNDGYQAADGTICCGGSRGQTCTTVTTGPYKNATPSGFTDSNSEWWKAT